MSRYFPKGTVINTLAVVIGSTLGLWGNTAISPELNELLFQIIGLCVTVLGIKTAFQFQSDSFLLILAGMLAGGIVGFFFYSQFSLNNNPALLYPGFTEAFILFCSGSLTVFGAFEEGLYGKRHLLYTKSLMDGVSSLVLAASFGIGVLYSAAALFLFQTALTLLAGWLKPLFDELTRVVFESIGGVLILVIGLNMMGAVKISTEILLPSLLIGPFLSKAYQAIRAQLEIG
ncbi:MAG TPA: DUF554 domain-containing protein [Saprospiraceae bacterium]|nr:DUF554 domain-containing protein [Saprospiraceae bacterium]